MHRVQPIWLSGLIGAHGFPENPGRYRITFALSMQVKTAVLHAWMAVNSDGAGLIDTALKPEIERDG